MLQTEVLLICGLVIVSVLVIATVWYIPKRQVNNLTKIRRDKKLSEFEREKERIKLEDDTRKTLAQIVGGIFLIAGLFFTYNTYRLGLKQQEISIQKQELDRRGQITDRFNKAVTNLGNQDLAVRLGGLYSLDQILKDSPEDYQTILEVLSAYIRQKGKTEEAKDADGELNSNTKLIIVRGKLLPDVEVAVTIIGKRPYSVDRDNVRINLSESSLTLADFRGLNFAQTDFERSELYQTDFTEADFAGANFKGAKIDHAKFENAKNLTSEQLESAVFDSIRVVGDKLLDRESALKYFREKEAENYNR